MVDSIGIPTGTMPSILLERTKLRDLAFVLYQRARALTLSAAREIPTPSTYTQKDKVWRSILPIWQANTINIHMNSLKQPLSVS
jgi:hypothetical protein